MEEEVVQRDEGQLLAVPPRSLHCIGSLSPTVFRLGYKTKQDYIIYEIHIILTDPVHKATRRNRGTQWITQPVHKYREMKM
ncbi:hypothetical protein A6R68_05360, partial [Neotoma lepida]